MFMQFDQKHKKAFCQTAKSLDILVENTFKIIHD